MKTDEQIISLLTDYSCMELSQKETADRIQDLIEIREREAAKQAWIEARRHYVGYNETIKIAVEQSFNKWYDQWKEENHGN